MVAAMPPRSVLDHHGLTVDEFDPERHDDRQEPHARNQVREQMNAVHQQSEQAPSGWI
jgi:hypothetical protein